MKNKAKPYIVDIFAVQQDNVTIVHSIISNFKSENTHSSYLSNSFTLSYKNVKYKNMILRRSMVNGIHVLKYLLPFVLSKSQFLVKIQNERDS